MSNSEDEIQWRIPDELKRSSSAIRYPPSAITAQLIRHYSAADPLYAIIHPLFSKAARHYSSAISAKLIRRHGLQGIALTFNQDRLKTLGPQSAVAPMVFLIADSE